MYYMDNGIEKEERKMKFEFICFANLVGTLNFDSDADYDDCYGWVELTDGSGNYVIYEPFNGAYERNVAMQSAFAEASKVMAKWAELQKGF